MMRHSCGLLIGLLCYVSASAQDNPGLLEVPPEEFAILPWGWSPADRAILEEMRQAGFNLAGFVSPEGLDTVAAAGLKAIVREPSTSGGDAAGRLSDSEIDQRVKSLTDRIGSHPAVFGYYLRDEPGTGDFEGLAKWSRAFRAAAPKALPYINLLPNYATSEQLGGGHYEQYVDTFLRAVQPSFLSYDNYSLMEDGTLRDRYFQNLEVIRSAGLRYGLPFWNVVLSNAHYHYAEPSQATLSLQAFSSLAYGARGISYYTYFTPTVGNYRLAPIDQFGHKTQTWDLLRRVNLQIHKLVPTYRHLTSVNVFHHPTVPADCRGLDSSRFLADLSGGNLMVGEFQDLQGKPALMVVNKDLHRSTPFALRVKSGGSIRIVNSYSGEAHVWDGSHAWLAPGQGMLLLLEPTN